MELKAMAEARKVFLKTFGCQMNVYDSERMSEALVADGYAETGDIADADLVILNTCHIREKAAEKVYSDLGRIRDLKEERKRQGRDTLIAVAGCVAQAEGAEIVRRAPAVDLVVGPQSYHRLPGLLAEAARGRSVVETSFPGDQKFAELEPRRRVHAPSAFLTVQEGCDKFCTFCVVPYTRGAEYSRPVAEVVAEARRLAEGGAREITLLGQNVNAYHGRDETGAEVSLASLIARLAEIDDLLRIRYMTSHPHNMTADLAAAHGDEPKLMPYLHLPFQSGSDRILAAMNRRHTADHYRAIIADVRRARPDLALSTDIIVGFPGETDADFAATVALVEEIGFAQSYSFKYSPRPGTPAAELDGEVPDEVASRRLLELQAILLAQQTAFNAAAVGRTVPVLFERTGREPGHLVGRTPHQQLVHVEADPAYLGTVEPVAITAHSSNSLQGRLVKR